MIKTRYRVIFTRRSFGDGPETLVRFFSAANEDEVKEKYRLNDPDVIDYRIEVL